MNIPNHIAIILDGNGRWAKSKGMPRNYGHVQGAKNVESVCHAADDLGVKFLTVYAFSTENWKRPASEVEALMQLLNQYMKKLLKTAKKENMRVKFIGDRSVLSPEIQQSMQILEETTDVCTGLCFTIALNYGGRDEIVRAARKLAQKAVFGEISPEDISEEMISGALDTAGVPDPDLMIRTSYELRTSNFLPWQLAYTELYFTEVPWPDFGKEELRKAVEQYSKRDRRFGGIKTEG